MEIEYSTIIKVEYIKKSGSLCRLSFDNRESFECSTDLVVKYSLGKGTKLNNTELEEIIYLQRTIDAKQAAYAFASYKPRTEFEVRRKLKQKNHSEAEISAAIKFLYEFDLLNDILYAEKFIDEKLRIKKYSSLKMIDELRKRGISKTTVEEKVIQKYENDTEYELARETAQKKIMMLADKPENKRKQALTAFLKQRKFRWEVIKRIIEEYYSDY